MYVDVLFCFLSYFCYMKSLLLLNMQKILNRDYDIFFYKKMLVNTLWLSTQDNSSI
jgi:hypothetical protein